MMKKIIAIFLAMALLVSTGGSAVFAENPQEMMPNQQIKGDAVPVLVDVFFLRPIGLASCVFGLAVSVIALPFAIPSGGMEKVSRELIQKPFVFTFQRPIGEDLPQENL